ncbi:hypothetical protein UFOVP1500_20 [uncultured Caudovirales phage]|uniref:Uncharacterized protein n=5 Tax=uncultured Caudovirales phage TaxID=2100421 RepID=A0A6J5MS18_9CAUD|nr:hypothetical protein UFOVP544_20 [uncultured Caudovirales phage]CAB4173800.1 hypothetical protein UFOVP976_14 [uncultured Caudovirales phage]CAB4185956.1 hypothetical protein UFOVP1140_18 [uncultured Caudovirales phage]CAB4217298.1 hypothetical protein UFOVP1500_20 [uncultured Caudovirales phage]
MSAWTPEWKVTINGVSTYASLTLANLTITSGRSDIYSQPSAGYCSVTIVNTNLGSISLDINDDVLIQVKNSSGSYVNLFGGTITDLDITVDKSGANGIVELISIKALGALAKLTKVLTDGVLAKAFDGTQIYSILEPLLFNKWSQVPAALTWANYTATTTWANAENSGIGEIDRPGDYELTSRASSPTTAYDLVTQLATSGLGYCYEDSSGRICYADSTHRSQYLAANGYIELSANHAIGSGLKISKRSGDVRNSVKITYKNNQTTSATNATSIATYGELGQNISTSLENLADANTQAAFYLALRAYPQYMFRSITFPIASSELDNGDRDALLNVFIGQPLDITNLPSNMIAGSFQGFVEGWTFSASKSALSLTLNLSPTAYSLQAFKWMDVPITEQWQTISPTLDWLNAILVS